MKSHSHSSRNFFLSFFYICMSIFIVSTFCKFLGLNNFHLHVTLWVNIKALSLAHTRFVTWSSIYNMWLRSILSSSWILYQNMQWHLWWCFHKMRNDINPWCLCALCVWHIISVSLKQTLSCAKLNCAKIIIVAGVTLATKNCWRKTTTMRITVTPKWCF